MAKVEDIRSDDIPSALKSLRNIKVQTSPFLTARVLANVELKTEKKRTWPVLITSAAGSLALVAALLLSGVLRLNSAESFEIGQAYAVKVDIRALETKEVAFAEIILDGDNVEFSSSDEAVKHSKRLVLSMAALRGKQYLPVVVKGTKAGGAQLAVRFIDHDQHEVALKSVALHFERSTI